MTDLARQVPNRIESCLLCGAALVAAMVETRQRCSQLHTVELLDITGPEVLYLCEPIDHQVEETNSHATLWCPECDHKHRIPTRTIKTI